MKIRRSMPEPRFEMTPLIDVVFLLLTFFIVAIVVMVRAEVLNIDLPTLTNAAALPPGSVVTVGVDVEGKLTVDGAPSSIETIVADITAARAASPQARLIVAVDQGGRNDTLLALLNALAGARISDFGIVGRLEPEEKPVEVNPRPS